MKLKVDSYMIQQQYPSKLLERAVQEFAKLPGVGRKTALRLVLYLLRQDAEDVEKLTHAILQMKHEVKRCSVTTMSVPFVAPLIVMRPPFVLSRMSRM